MFEGLTKAARDGLGGIVSLYRDVNFAYFLAVLMGLTALALVAVALVTHALRSAALLTRRRAISSFITFGSEESGNGADSREATFAARFPEIDARLQSGGFLEARLADAWRRYRKTLTFVGAPPIRSSQRPNAFFYSANPPPTWLGFAAGLIVATGLLLTFLGLVAALNFASEGMQSRDIAETQTAVRDLLAAASSKFVTSVAGVGLSIVLRLVERLLTIDLRNKVDRLSQAIEFGVPVDNDAHSAAIADRIGKLVERIDPHAPPGASA